jgi:hypothetical protein
MIMAATSPGIEPATFKPVAYSLYTLAILFYVRAESEAIV